MDLSCVRPFPISVMLDIGLTLKQIVLHRKNMVCLSSLELEIHPAFTTKWTNEMFFSKSCEAKCINAYDIVLKAKGEMKFYTGAQTDKLSTMTSCCS